MKTELIHLSELSHGDTIIINGEMETVNRKNIVNDFMGIRYKGDGFRGDNGMVTVALFPRRYKGEIISYSRQV